MLIIEGYEEEQDYLSFRFARLLNELIKPHMEEKNYKTPYYWFKMPRLEKLLPKKEQEDLNLKPIEKTALAMYRNLEYKEKVIKMYPKIIEKLKEKKVI